MVRHDHCPLCSGKNISGFLKCTDHFLSRESFEIFKCSDCGFVFTQDHPGEAEAGRYYESEEYISHTDSKKSITDLAYQMIRKLMLMRKNRLVRKYTGISAGKILDIGCGTGHFLSSMKLAGWETVGIEINEKARNYAGSKFNIEVITPGKIITLGTGSFDCITLWHVLEHFHEPYRTMEEVYRILKPGGICLIALPNNNSFDAKYYRQEWAAFDVPRHLWHFNQDTFSLFAELNKFKLHTIKTLPFDVFYISILSEKYRNQKMAFLIGSLKGLYFSMKSFIVKSGSSSFIYVLRKSEN
jgi:2-polyprenyl-3-methyl-5-hydroxy-6-metoxy-1,4-benzoquinol methylase